MQLYIARHARPELPDGEKRFLGQADPPLGAVGLEQARTLAARLRPVGFGAIFSSDLARCLLTAETVARDVGIAVTPDARLREIDTGLWEGLTSEQVRRRYPREYAERETDPIGHRFPGGESFRDVQKRAIPALREIIERGDERALVVAHLGVNRIILAHLRQLPFEQLFSIRQDYCDFEVVGVPLDS